MRYLIPVILLIALVGFFAPKIGWIAMGIGFTLMFLFIDYAAEHAQDGKDDTDE